LVSGVMMERGTPKMKIKPPYGKDKAKLEWAYKKLSKSAWKMFTKDHDTGKVIEAGVQVLVQHEEWADIIKVVYMATKDGGE
jgi:hypothetical protein